MSESENEFFANKKKQHHHQLRTNERSTKLGLKFKIDNVLRAVIIIK